MFFKGNTKACRSRLGKLKKGQKIKNHKTLNRRLFPHFAKSGRPVASCRSRWRPASISGSRHGGKRTPPGIFSNPSSNFFRNTEMTLKKTDVNVTPAPSPLQSKEQVLFSHRVILFINLHE